jgi:hypothetical protein
MKNIILASSLVLSFFANAGNAKEKSLLDEVTPYGGVLLGVNYSSSEYAMNFEVNKQVIPHAGGVVGHKKNNIPKLGYGVFVGLQGGQDYYYALEVGVTLHHFKLGKIFKDYESKEMGNYSRNLDATALKCTYGNEYNVSLKFGKNISGDTVKNMRVYGILGGCTRNVRLEYDYFYHPMYTTGRYWKFYPRNFRKQIYGIAIGLGAESKICDKCSLGIEYKHTFYSNINKNFDLQSAGLIDGASRGDYDVSERNYKLKSDQNSISLRFIVKL